MNPSFDYLIMGAIAMASFVAGLFFLRFWRDTGDRLFAIFAGAFWLLGLTRIALVALAEENENRTFVYWVRLLAFILIIVAVIDKNRPKQNHAGPAN